VVFVVEREEHRDSKEQPTVNQKIKDVELKESEKRSPKEWTVGDSILDQYEVMSVLGRGGFGEVFKVHHHNWDLDLAVKSLLPELFSDDSELEAFVQECQAWIDLGQHPNIVTCYYVRILGEIPRVFAEYMQGGNLRTLLSNKKLPITRVIELAIQALDGLAYAHNRGLIHLDVKPENMLLDANGIIKITDFGIALGIGVSSETPKGNSTNSTRVEAGLPGTPAYIPPEQWDVTLGNIGPWTDIYAFGIMLFEMVCGQRPFDKDADSIKVLRERHLKNKPPNPQELRSDLPTKISELILSCLEKDSNLRPQSCGEVSEVLNTMYKELSGKQYLRLIEDEVVLRADSLNNRGVSQIDLGNMDLAILAFDEAIELNPHHLEAVYNRGLALWRSAKLTDADYLKQLINVKSSDHKKASLLSQIHLEQGDVESAMVVLEAGLNEYGDVSDLRTTLQEIKKKEPKKHRTLFSAENGVSVSPIDIKFLPDGQRIITVGRDKKIEWWNIETGKSLRSVILWGDEIARSIAVSPDESRILVERWKKKVKTELCESTDTVVFKGELRGAQSPFVMSPCGKYVLTGGGGVVSVWDLESGKLVINLEHPKVSWPIGYFPDANEILTGCWGENLRVWNLNSQDGIHILEGSQESMGCGAMSADGRWALTGANLPEDWLPQTFQSSTRTLIVWNLESGKQTRALTGHEGNIESVRVSPDGQWGFSRSAKSIRLWELQSGRCIRTFEAEGHQLFWSIAISPDGEWLASTGLTSLDVWPLNLDSKGTRGIKRRDASYDICRPRDVLELSENEAKALELIESANAAIASEEWKSAADVIRRARSISGFENNPVLVDLWSRVGAYGRRIGFLAIHQTQKYTHSSDNINALAISFDGSLSASSILGEILVWNTSTSESPKSFYIKERDNKKRGNLVKHLSFTSDNKWLLSIESNGTIRRWNTNTGECVQVHKKAISGRSGSVTYSEDRSLACIQYSSYSFGSMGEKLTLWDMEKGRKIHEFKGQRKKLEMASDMTPDGQLIVSAGTDDKRRKIYQLCLWDVKSGKCIQSMEGSGGGWNTVVAISPVGSHAAVSSFTQGDIHLWSTKTGNLICNLEGHDLTVNSLKFTSDGQYLISSDETGSIRLWDVNSCECLNIQERVMTKQSSAISISTDARWLLTAAERTVYWWEIEWDYKFV